jgi:hypothetical protein
MGGSLKKYVPLGHQTLREQSDQRLTESYLELLELRQQVRVAQCGRPISAGQEMQQPWQNENAQ